MDYDKPLHRTFRDREGGTTTMEEYLEVIYELEHSEGVAKTNDIARLLDVQPASVTEMIQKLSDQGLVQYERYRGVVLTDQGSRIAGDLRESHRTLRDFLISIGVNEDIAERDACRIEHQVSPETTSRLRFFLEFLKDSEPACLAKFRRWEEDRWLGESAPKG